MNKGIRELWINYRNESGLGLNHVARLMKKSKAYISQIENGYKLPSVDATCLFASVLGRDATPLIEALLIEKGERNTAEWIQGMKRAA